MKAPFPYFGGKSTVADEVWARLGCVDNYVEPFAGSLAVLLSRPHAPKVETVNDKDRFLANFWRAVQLSPEETAQWADWPVNETDLEARHHWLVTEGVARLTTIIGDPYGYDAQVAGWWLWGCCAWIGSGWCAGKGPWAWTGSEWSNDAGQGINRKLPHLGGSGQGINRKLPHLGGAGRGEYILDWIQLLSSRLRDVRVACGDWTRVCGNTPTTHQAGITGVLLDPPYSAIDRSDVYNHEDREVAKAAREWAIEVGKHSRMRIAFCGYDGEFAEPWPDGWSEYAWKAKGGYASQGEDENINATRERVWFSPACLTPKQPDILSYYEVRFLPHGQEPEPGETVQELRGHHGTYSRLAVRA